MLFMVNFHKTKSIKKLYLINKNSCKLQKRSFFCLLKICIPSCSNVFNIHLQDWNPLDNLKQLCSQILCQLQSPGCRPNVNTIITFHPCSWQERTYTQLMLNALFFGSETRKKKHSRQQILFYSPKARISKRNTRNFQGDVYTDQIWIISYWTVNSEFKIGVLHIQTPIFRFVQSEPSLSHWAIMNHRSIIAMQWQDTLATHIAKSLLEKLQKYPKMLKEWQSHFRDLALHPL